MNIVINSADELIQLRKAICVYKKRKQLSIDSIQRLRAKTRGGVVIPELRNANTIEDLDHIREDMIERRQQAVTWCDNFIDQINLQLSQN